MEYFDDNIAGEHVSRLHGPEGFILMRKEMHWIGTTIGHALSCALSDRREAEHTEQEIGSSKLDANSAIIQARMVRGELAERAAQRQAMDAIRALGRGLRIALGNTDPSINGQASGLTADEFLLLSSVMGLR